MTTKIMNTIKEEEDYHLLLLPDEITTEILLRLPTQSVMQCKRVCKTWRALIADPSFIHIHTRRSISYYTLNPTTAETEWIILKVVSHLQFVKYYYNNEDSGHIKVSKPIIYHPRSRILPYISKISSCNGLILMNTLVTTMFVCNPFTREYIDLPQIAFNIPRDTQPNDPMMRVASGFGYHSSTDEYKVVVIIYYCSSYICSKGQVTIYTLGSGGWRDKGEISHRLIDGAKHDGKQLGGVLFNGALHWLTEKMDDEIVSFDLADEEFRIVPSPTSPISLSLSQSQSQLGLLGGCLYRSIENPAQRSTDIWVMDNNNMEYSWSRKFNISWKSGLSNPRPLALLKSGKILLHCFGKRLVSYDPETGSSVFVGKSKFPSVYTYMKTIVSLKALGEADAMIYDPDVCESVCSEFIKKRKRERELINKPYMQRIKAVL